MDVRRYLNTPRNIRRKIDQVQQRISELSADMSTVRGVNYDRVIVDQSMGDAMAEFAAEINELENKRDELILEYNHITKRIYEEINAMQNDNYRDVLYWAHIARMSLPKVAEKMQYDYDYTRHLHVKALKAFDWQLKNKTQNDTQ